MKVLKFLVILNLFLFIGNLYGQVAYEISREEGPMTLPEILKYRKHQIVKFKFYEFLAQKGDTLTYQKEEGNSIIIVPPNALITQNGQLYKGKVKLIYREIYKVSQIVLLNVSMKTNSGEQLATFGMFEMYAFDTKGNPLYISKQKQITVEMVNSYEPNDQIGFYKYDTIKNNWIPLAQKPQITRQPIASGVGDPSIWRAGASRYTPKYNWEKGKIEKPKETLAILPLGNDQLTIFATKYKINVKKFGFFNIDFVLKRPNTNIMLFTQFENLSPEEVKDMYIIYHDYRSVVHYEPKFYKKNYILVIKYRPFKLIVFTKDNKLKVLPDDKALNIAYYRGNGTQKIKVQLEEYNLEKEGIGKLVEILEG